MVVVFLVQQNGRMTDQLRNYVNQKVDLHQMKRKEE